MKNLLILTLTLIMASMTSTAFAKTYLSQKEIQSSPRGYTLESHKYGKFRVLNIKARTSKKSECKVYIPSLVKELERMKLTSPKPGKSAIHVTVKLKMLGDTIGATTICSGPGNDCTVELELSV